MKTCRLQLAENDECAVDRSAIYSATGGDVRTRRNSNPVGEKK
jgi:hypothetical protein